MVCFLELKDYTTAERIITANSFFQSVQWKHCIGLCTASAAAITSHREGVATQFKKIVLPDFVTIHGFIHRQQLASKYMTTELSEVLSQAVIIVNFVKASSVNCRILTIWWGEIDPSHTSLFLLTYIRCLSRKNTMARLIDLRGRSF